MFCIDHEMFFPFFKGAGGGSEELRPNHFLYGKCFFSVEEKSIFAAG